MYYWILVIIAIVAFGMYFSNSVKTSEGFSCPPKYNCSTSCSDILTCVNEPQYFKLREKRYIPLVAPSGGWVPTLN
jgi:hypothetical protein